MKELSIYRPFVDYQKKGSADSTNVFSKTAVLTRLLQNARLYLIRYPINIGGQVLFC